MKIRDLRGQPRPRAYYLDLDIDSVTADTVIDADELPEWINTGLLGADGAPIYRRRSTVKFGFVP